MAAEDDAVLDFDMAGEEGQLAISAVADLTVVGDWLHAISTLLFPMMVIPPPLMVPVLMVTNSRIRFPSPMSRRVGSPL